MSRRLHPTLADYLVIAVSPALIMALVGSLMFFLIEVSYQGQYVERLHFVVACFVLAAVLIARISIEMGSSHAMMYAAPLGIAAILALSRFIRFPDGPMATYGVWINVGMIALIWWCANKLTWDCTFIDESREESGEGVLRSMGLDRPPSPPTPLPQAGEGSCRAPSKKPRPHSGGIWVVYFSLAALPLFGIGQRFLPAGDDDRRRYAFLLLCVYVASGLGLLLTTSFLGLRRYLRGRRLQMPATMAGAWVTIGCLLIAAILGFALLLPRPNPEYAISEVPWQVSSENREASRRAVGREGTQDDRKDAPGGDNTRADPSQPKPPKGDGNQPDSSGQQTSQPGRTREGKSPDSTGDEKDSKGGSQGESKGDQSKPGSEGERKASENQARDSSETGQKGEQDQDKAGASGERKGAPGQRPDSQRDGKSQEGEKADQPSPQAPPPAPQPSAPAPSWSLPLGGILKWVFYLAVIAGVAYWAWKSRAALAQALKDFLEAWRAFWASLFGGKRGPKEAVPGEAVAEAAPAPRPFSDYADPFEAGWAERWSPDELVRYSFAALEAWAREHGCPRGPEETPYEFAEGVAGRAKQLRNPCRKMADLYSRAAYAPGTLPATSVAPLREFWQQITSA